MNLYLARKGNIQFYIQPDMIEDYSALGYEIFKLEEVPVTNIKKEAEFISAQMGIANEQN